MKLPVIPVGYVVPAPWVLTADGTLVQSVPVEEDGWVVCYGQLVDPERHPELHMVLQVFLNEDEVRVPDFRTKDGLIYIIKAA